MDPKIAELVIGSEKLTSIFGEWPSFHDAEVIEMYFDRGTLLYTESTFMLSSLTLKVQLFDETGELPFEHSTVAVLHFEALEGFQSSGWAEQNSLQTLAIKPIPFEGNWRFEVRLDAHCGVSATFQCSGITVVDAENSPRNEPISPWMPFGRSQPGESQNEWSELESLFLNIPIPPFTRSPISFQKLVSTPVDQREALLVQSYQPLVPDVVAALTRYFEIGTLPDLSSEQFHVALTIRNYALAEVMTITGKAHDSVIPRPAFPLTPVRQVAIDMVTMWWPQVGWQRFLTDVETRRGECLTSQFTSNSGD